MKDKAKELLVWLAIGAIAFMVVRFGLQIVGSVL
jgi:hypothetical protein